MEYIALFTVLVFAWCGVEWLIKKRRDKRGD